MDCSTRYPFETLIRKTEKLLLLMKRMVAAVIHKEELMLKLNEFRCNH